MVRSFIRKRSDMLMSKCPPDHALVVHVIYGFTAAHTEVRASVDYNDRTTGGAMEKWLAQQKKTKLTPSGEPVTEEHFEALLALRLTKPDRRFAEHFANNKNQPASLAELRSVSSRPKRCIASINKTCLIQGLWLQCRQT
jgi:hypothetical protein